MRDRLTELMDTDFSDTRDTSEGSYKSDILKSDDQGYIGQVISEGGFNHLVSICKKESFKPERFRAASEMRTKVNKQDRFEL